MLNLQLTKPQAKIIYRALDMFMRIRCGQMKIAMEEFLIIHFTHENMNVIRDLMEGFDRTLSRLVHKGSSGMVHYSIGAEEVGDEARAAYEMYHEIGKIISPDVPIHQGHTRLFNLDGGLGKKIIKEQL